MQISPVQNVNPNFNAKINWNKNYSSTWNDNVTEIVLGRKMNTAKAFEKIISKIDDGVEYSINFIQNPINYRHDMGACPFAVCKNGKPLYEVAGEGKRVIDEIFLQTIFYDYPHELLNSAIETGWLESTFRNARNAAAFLRTNQGLNVIMH